jgi:hypothetical protein
LLVSQFLLSPDNPAIDHPHFLQCHLSQNDALTSALPVSCDEEAIEKAKQNIQNSKVDFIWCRFTDLAGHYNKAHRMQKEAMEIGGIPNQKGNTNVLSQDPDHQQHQMDDEVDGILRKYAKYIEEIHSALPANGMLIVSTGSEKLSDSVGHSHGPAPSSLLADQQQEKANAENASSLGTLRQSYVYFSIKS